MKGAFWSTKCSLQSCQTSHPTNWCLSTTGGGSLYLVIYIKASKSSIGMPGWNVEGMKAWRAWLKSSPVTKGNWQKMVLEWISHPFPGLRVPRRLKSPSETFCWRGYKPYNFLQIESKTHTLKFKVFWSSYSPFEKVDALAGDITVFQKTCKYGSWSHISVKFHLRSSNTFLLLTTYCPGPFPFKETKCLTQLKVIFWGDQHRCLSFPKLQSSNQSITSGADHTGHVSPI